MALLPSFFVLQSGGKFLSLTENIPPNVPSGFLKFEQEPIWSPRVKFAVEPAISGDGQFVHIRCCYNNKYLVITQIDKNIWIVASAKKTEEDVSKDTCTLFEPYSSEDDETTTVRLRPVETAEKYSFVSCDDVNDQGMTLSSVESVFNVIDWRSVLILPSQVAFKSEDLNGNYLRSVFLYQRLIYQRFAPELDIADPLVANELLPNPITGNYRIKDLYTNTFWRRRDNWIKGERDDGTNETLFSFVHIENNVVAIRNLGNNNFCGPFTEDLSIDCLNARYPNITRQTRLIVEECVVRREISNIEYRLNDSRIYDEQIIEVSHAFGDNDTSTQSTLTLSFAVTDSVTRSWNNSVSINFGVTTSMTVNLVPLIVSGTIQTTTEFGFSHEWGETKTTTTERSVNYAVTIPPFTRMRVGLMSSRARSDVPFSYTQRDLLTSGRWVSTRKHDGVFNGINSYNFNFQSTEVPPAS